MKLGVPWAEWDTNVERIFMIENKNAPSDLFSSHCEVPPAQSKEVLWNIPYRIEVSTSRVEFPSRKNKWTGNKAPFFISQSTL